MFVSDFGDRFDIKDMKARVADRFGEYGLRLLVDGTPEVFRIRRVDEAHGDAVFRQGGGEEIIGASVQIRRSYDLVPGSCDIQDREGDGRHARRYP